MHPVVARHQAAAGQRSAHELCQEQILAQQMNVEVEEAEAKRAASEASKALASGNKQLWEYWRREEVVHKAAEAEWRGKMRFTGDQMRIHESANSNLQQALILGDGARELQATMGAMESLRVEDNLDAMREHADTVADHNTLFSQPLLQPSLAEMRATEDLDDEWERLQAARVADSLPAASTGAPGGGMTVPVSAGATVERRTVSEANQ